jgi:hypothetical protein
MTASLAGTYNITCPQGANLKRSITWASSKKIPHDLTGYTAKMQVRTNDLAETLILELSTNNGYITLLGAVKNNITFNVPADITKNLTVGMFVYDLFLTAPNNEVYQILEGNFKVKPEVTR